MEKNLKRKRETVSNTNLIDIITVDKERNRMMSNGFVDLNGDIVMRLIKIIGDEEKIRNVIGMTKVFYSWTKLKIFEWAKSFVSGSILPIVFFPEKPLSGVTYLNSKISFYGDLSERIVSVDHKSLSLPRIFALIVLIEGFSAVGIALRSVFTELHSGGLENCMDICVLEAMGVHHRNTIYGYTWWSAFRAPDVNNPALVRLELNQITHTLHFFVNDTTQMELHVVNVPVDVCFMISPTYNESEGKSTAEVCSFRSIRTSTVDPTVWSKAIDW